MNESTYYNGWTNYEIWSWKLWLDQKHGGGVIITTTGADGFETIGAFDHP